MHPTTQMCTLKSHPDSWSGAAARSLYGRRSIVTMLASCVCWEISNRQEVDCFDDLAHLFKKDGFEGVYKFSLLHQENIEFQSFGLQNNVALLSVLKSKQNQLESEITPQTLVSPCAQNRSVVIGNTHVLFNPNRGDIVGQVLLFLEKAHELSQEWGSIPVIISGDLNSIPQSPMYQFLASSELDIQLHNRRHISGQVDSGSEYQNEKASRKYISRPLRYIWDEGEVRLATGSEGATCLQHHLKLCSAYLGGSCRTRDRCGEPLATSYHSKFMGTVDYIRHTEELVPVRVLETLLVYILRRIGGLPCKMDWYQRVEKPRVETPIDENEIRIISQGRTHNYITYPMTLLQEKESDKIVFKAMGRAINTTVTIVELIKVSDISLADYIGVVPAKHATYIPPHNAGRFSVKRFSKAQCPIVVRLTNSHMMHGRNNGKKLMAVRIIRHAVEIIHFLTDQNPIQIIVDAVVNSGPRDDKLQLVLDLLALGVRLWIFLL